jgi:hypothetical protein
VLKAAIVLTSLAVVVTVAAGIGSKLASGKVQLESPAGPRISPMEIMLKFDMGQPADEIQDLI